MPNYSVYLHIPFCTHKCGYCDFNTYAGLDSQIPAYVEALIAEIHFLRQAAGTRFPVHTVFFGGGTPSLLPLDDLERILDALETAFQLDPVAEITLEANPGTLSLDYLRSMRSMRINRLSLGMQTSVPEELDLLERQHTFVDVIKSVHWARSAGFDNLNLDLIFGLPYQPLSSWQKSLDLALELDPDHFSLYALTLEHGTPMHSWVQRGLLSAPNPDLAAQMYESASERLDGAGFAQYEISNWARKPRRGKDYACRHNLQYWRNQPYLGVGAGAHGFVPGSRTSNVLAPAAYVQRFDRKKQRDFPRTPATLEFFPIDRGTEMRETMLMGLRLTEEGVTKKGFEARFGQPLEGVFSAEVDRLIGRGLLEWAGHAGDTLRLTGPGRLLGNQVFLEFV